MSLASEAMFTVELQRRRAKGMEPEDDTFANRWWIDLQFLIVALYRLRRVARLAENVPSVRATIAAAGATFDQRLPTLTNMRHVMEHFDDYALDVGRNVKVSRHDLQVGTWDGKVWQWSQIGQVDVDDAFDAAKVLYKAIIGAKPTEDLRHDDGFVIAVDADDAE